MIHCAALVADDDTGRQERDWDLAQAIRHLPAWQRVTIVLHYYHGMTIPSMARVLQRSESTLKRHLQAALSTLRRVLQADERDERFV